MVRQAQSYLAGAASSAALLAAAIATFVLLASFTAFREWPLPGFGDSVSESVTSTISEPPAAAQAAAVALAPATTVIADTEPLPSAIDTAPIDEGFVPDPPQLLDPDPGFIPGPGPDVDPVDPPVIVNPPIDPPLPLPDTGRQDGVVGPVVDDLEDTVTTTTDTLGLGPTVETTTEVLLGEDTVLNNTVETTVNVLGGTLRGILGDHRP